DGALWCFHPVIASVERPRAAKDAVPRAISAEFDGSGRIGLPDKIFPAIPRQMASRQQIVERLDECRWRSAVIECHAAWNLSEVAPTFLERIEQPADCCFTFSGQHAIHSACAVTQNFLGNKRHAMAANTDKCIRQQVACRSCQINNFGHVCKIVPAE